MVITIMVAVRIVTWRIKGDYCLMRRVVISGNPPLRHEGGGVRTWVHGW